MLCRAKWPPVTKGDRQAIGAIQLKGVGDSCMGWRVLMRIRVMLSCPPAVLLELFNLLGLLMIKVPLHRVYQLKAILHEFFLYVDDIVG